MRDSLTPTAVSMKHQTCRTVARSTANTADSGLDEAMPRCHPCALELMDTNMRRKTLAVHREAFNGGRRGVGEASGVPCRARWCERQSTTTIVHVNDSDPPLVLVVVSLPNPRCHIVIVLPAIVQNRCRWQGSRSRVVAGGSRCRCRCRSHRCRNPRCRSQSLVLRAIVVAVVVVVVVVPIVIVADRCRCRAPSMCQTQVAEHAQPLLVSPFCCMAP